MFAFIALGDRQLLQSHMLSALRLCHSTRAAGATDCFGGPVCVCTGVHIRPVGQDDH